MVAPTLTLTFDQPDAGLPAGQTDRARTDIKSTGSSDSARAYAVLITVGGVPDGASADVALLDEPPGANPLLTQLSPSSWQLEFDKGTWGPFRVRARALLSDTVLASVVRRISIRSPQLGFQYPANAERTDPAATSVATSPSVALTEMNEGGTNNSLAAFHRELISKVESAVAAGGIAEPALHTKLYDTSIEYLAEPDKYRVSAPLQARVTSSMQPGHRATFPVDQFTPGPTLGIAPLTDSNIVAAIENARLWASSQKGGLVLVPLGPHDGLWAIPAGSTIPDGSILSGAKKAGVVFRGTYQPLWLEGAPGSGFIVPADADVGVYFMSPDNTGSSTFGVHHDGGMRNIVCTPAASGQVTQAFRVNAAVNCVFEKLLASGFNGSAGGVYGSGLRVSDDWAGGNGNSQFCRFNHVLCDSNQIDFDMHEITRSKFEACNSQGAAYRGWLLTAGADVSIYNSGLQEIGLNPVFEMIGNAYAVLVDCYTEGSQAGDTFFKADSITGTSVLSLVRYHNVDFIGTLLDVDAAVSVSVMDCYITQATKILKAHPGNPTLAGPYLFINNVGFADAVDALDATKFDVDAYARERLYIAKGGQTYAGGECIHGAPVRLASYAEGSEPTSPVETQLLWNANTHRPRVRGASAHHDVALVDDPRDLSKLLAPYAIDCWDPAIAKRRSIVSGTLDTLAGALNGTLIAAVDSSHRPVWNASDPLFLGRPSFSCTVAGGQYMIASTIPTQPIGTPLGAFIVARLTGSLPQTGNRNFIYSAALQVFADDTDNAGANGWQAIDSGSSPGRRAGASLTHDLNPHVIIVGNRASSGQWDCLADGVRGFADTYSAIASAFSGPVQFGAFNGVASDVTITFIALLNLPLPLSVETQAIALASSINGLGL